MDVKTKVNDSQQKMQKRQRSSPEVKVLHSQMNEKKKTTSWIVCLAGFIPIRHSICSQLGKTVQVQNEYSCLNFMFSCNFG